jgi:diacylglycerol kinase (ATP)
VHHLLSIVCTFTPYFLKPILNLQPKILFVINPNAGPKGKSELLSQLHALLGLLVIDCKQFIMTGADDFKAIENEIRIFQPDIVTAVGGDGTCNLVAQLVMNTPIAMGIIPFGSANGMATELNIPKGMNAAMLNLLKGIPKSIDLLLINEKDIAMHLSDVGLNAKIVKRFTIENKRGLWRYIIHFFTEYFLLKHYPFIINCDGKTSLRKAISITFANASKYGTGAVINPIGIIDDGKFELCIIKPFPWYYLLPLTLKFFYGNLTNSKYVEIIRCSEASITTKKKLVLQVDGEIKQKVNTVSVRILPKFLKVLVPKESNI